MSVKWWWWWWCSVGCQVEVNAWCQGTGHRTLGWIVAMVERRLKCHQMQLKLWISVKMDCTHKGELDLSKLCWLAELLCVPEELSARQACDLSGWSTIVEGGGGVGGSTP